MHEDSYEERTYRVGDIGRQRTRPDSLNCHGVGHHEHSDVPNQGKKDWAYMVVRLEKGTMESLSKGDIIDEEREACRQNRCVAAGRYRIWQERRHSFSPARMRSRLRKAEEHSFGKRLEYPC
jgi:hypothetical protein